jgi:hypothetical protein
LKWMQNRCQLPSSARYIKPKRDVDWSALTRAVSGYNAKFLHSEEQPSQLLQCSSSSLLSAVMDTVQASSPSISQSNFWDVYSCWGVLSPLEIPHRCSSSSKIPTWRLVFRSPLLHMESCRLVFLLKCSAKIASSPNTTYTIRIRQLLSPKSIQLLELCTGPVSSSLLRPSSLLQADSGDEFFNQIQSRFRRNGVIPFASAAATAGPGPVAGMYWICFLLLHCSSGEAALRFATLEMARNSLSFVEYSSWPLTFIASLLESLSSATTAGAAPESLPPDPYHATHIYRRLESFLGQLRL